MSWDALFGFTNGVAVIAWAVILFLPRGPRTSAMLLYAGVGILCLTYVMLIVGMHAGWLDSNRLPGAPPPNFLDYDIAGLRNLFMSDGGLVLGWTHYLALDLFAGLWIAKDADNKAFSRLTQAPFLMLTFLAGPVGLLLWLLVRERRARKLARG
ncbi:abscisic acid-deficient protein Aba4 family protein [Sphingomonas xanthus]|uniref:DUF4281 domain-containing protein n=1 Tax=Sphingomonas xanthus TaxID=2594473 RepID=A0A516ITC1_9SPHN|nr:abscisic acid-deficient protein Aba4 family protein [Sphingomonas xanthus]QDP20178.1 DUF4281 domain-containing protein [Sphingomonas xanthus]